MVSRLALWLAVAVALLPALAAAPAALLDTTADAVLGQTTFAGSTANQGGPASATTLNDPRAITVDGATGRVYVADSGNNRVLGYANAQAFTSGAAAEVVLGQTDFTSTLLNQGAGASATSLALPSGVATDPAGNLYVADRINHRVLVYLAPIAPGAGRAADIVFGQGGLFTTAIPNQGGLGPASLLAPTGVHISEQGHLLIADRGNHRVLVIPAPLLTQGTSTGQPATVCIGQADCSSAVPGTTASRLNLPEGVFSYPDGRIVVADTANHRVLVFPNPLTPAGVQPATQVIGQPNFTSGNPNRDNGMAVANGLAGPRGVWLDSSLGLWVADTTNSRAVRFPPGPAGDLAGTAEDVLGQPDFASSMVPFPPTASSLHLPYGIAVDGAGNVYVADTLNHRALRYDQPRPLPAPLITGLAPNRVVLPAGGMILTVFGRGFHSGGPNSPSPPTTILLNGASNGITTTWLSPWRLVATIPAGAFGEGSGPWGIQAITGLPSGNLISGSVSLEAVTPIPGDREADRVLGQGTLDERVAYLPLAGLANTASPGNLLDPVGVAVDPVTGRVWVTDRSLNRVLGFPSAAALGRGQPADIVLGQPDLQSYRFNRGLTSPNATTLSRPRGVTVDAAGTVYVADSGNHRVLVYPAPQSTGMAASRVIGQPNFTTATPNNGGLGVRTLNGPWGVTAAPDGLYVADTGNNRVLLFETPGAGPDFPPASRVYGQEGSFTTTTPGSSRERLNGPRGVGVTLGQVWIADTGNHRVVGFAGTSTSATIVTGQNAFGLATPNGGGAVSATGLHTPSSVAADRAGNLYVADLANNRVVVWPTGTSGAGAPATAVLGQPDLTTSTPGVGPGQLDFPFAVALDAAGNLWVTDSGNLRVVRYDRPLQPPITSQLPQVFMRNAAGW